MVPKLIYWIINAGFIPDQAKSALAILLRNCSAKASKLNWRRCWNETSNFVSVTESTYIFPKLFPFVSMLQSFRDFANASLTSFFIHVIAIKNIISRAQLKSTRTCCSP